MDSQLTTLRIWTEDQPGVLCRVVNIVAAHGVNIVRLSAGSDPARAGMAAITMVARLTAKQAASVVRRMRGLVQVRLVLDLTGGEGLRASGRASAVRHGVAA